MIRQFSIEVSGRVQGVFFRASTQKKAISLSLAGYVMNKPDGCVFMIVQGEEEDIQKMVSWCRTGPQLARVDNVTFIEESEISDFLEFEIRR